MLKMHIMHILTSGPLDPETDDIPFLPPCLARTRLVYIDVMRTVLLTIPSFKYIMANPQNNKK